MKTKKRDGLIGWLAGGLTLLCLRTAFFGYKFVVSQRESALPELVELEEKTVRRVMEEREVDGTKIVAYRLTDGWSEDSNSGVFAIEVQATMFRPLVFSVASPVYGDDKVFEIVGKNQVWVINAQTNGIDVYQYTPYRKVNNVIGLARMTYMKTITLPSLSMGEIHALTCDDGVCNISTAHHLQSGCDFSYKISTGEFSKPLCRNMRGEFSL